MAYEGALQKIIGYGAVANRPAATALAPQQLGIWINNTVTPPVRSYCYGGAWHDAAETAGGLPEAPNDGKQYARKNKAWAEIVAGGGGGGTTQSITSAATITPAVTDDIIEVSELAVATTIANPSGTAAIGQGFVISIFSAAALGISWGSAYAGMDAAPVATTTAGKLIDIPVRYSATLGKWMVYKPSMHV